ncbi:MAG: PIN domain-containing protein [Anaerolineae bacterium]
MEDEIRVFLDTSALFAGVHSETGGARLILKLGEAGAIQLWVGPWVLREADGVIERKSPRSKAYFAMLLDRSQVKIGREAGDEALEKALEVVDYLPDAQVVAEALTIGVDYLVSFDREHLVGNPRGKELPFLLGTAGDFLAWYRARTMEHGGHISL